MILCVYVLFTLLFYCLAQTLSSHFIDKNFVLSLTLGSDKAFCKCYGNTQQTALLGKKRIEHNSEL